MKVSEKKIMWISRLKGFSEYSNNRLRDSRKAYYYKLSTNCREREGPASLHLVNGGHI